MRCDIALKISSVNTKSTRISFRRIYSQNIPEPNILFHIHNSLLHCIINERSHKVGGTERHLHYKSCGTMIGVATNVRIVRSNVPAYYRRITVFDGMTRVTGY